MLTWAGDNWLKRNKADLGKHDPVCALLDDMSIILAGCKVVEIGCADGWRLKKLQHKYACQVIGLDPSRLACTEALTHNGVLVRQGIAAALPWPGEGLFDLVIMGFCMWMTEPSEWFRNVSESDRVLKDGGYLIIHDYSEVRPLRHRYNYDSESAGHNDVWCYFFDWTKLWLVHPAYSVVRENMALSNRETVSVLRKNLTNCVGTPGA